MMGETYYITHAFIEPSQEAKDNMAFRMEQARQSMKHSLLDGTTVYTKASQTDVAVLFAKEFAKINKQNGKQRMRKVK